VKRLIQLAIILAATALLLVLFTRGISIAEVWRQIAAADVAMLIAAQTVAIGAYFLRAWRWQFLLRPLGPTRFVSALKATVIGFSASFLLPGRTGEVLRPYLLARREGFSVVSTITTVVLERILDMIGVLLLFASVVIVARPQPTAENAGIFRAMQLGGLAAGAISIAAFVVLMLLAKFPALARRIVMRIAGAVSPRVGEKLGGLAGTFADGLAVLRNAKDAAAALAGAFPIWLCSAASIWFVSEAFGLGIPVSGSMLMVMLLVLGIAVPTPGGVGGVHYAFRFGATALYAAADDRAVGAAIVFHAMTVVPISLLGLVFAAAEGLNMRGLRTVASTVAASRGVPNVEPAVSPR
jgi:uncharacterized protein (TIRG00374 family)